MINLYPGETENPRCDWLCISGNTPSFDHNNIVFECLLIYFCYHLQNIGKYTIYKVFSILLSVISSVIKFYVK